MFGEFIVADDRLRVDELFGHDQIKSRDMLEVSLSFLSIQAPNLVVDSWQLDVRTIER